MGGAQGRLTRVPRASAEADESWRHKFWPSCNVANFVVSFPKAGRTWLRVLMAVAEAHARASQEELVVQEWLEHEAPLLDGRQVLFTHALAASTPERPAAMGQFLSYIGDSRRLFLVRDPRDTIVSYYFQVARRESRSFGEPEGLARFVRDPVYGIDRLLAFLQFCIDSFLRDAGPAMLLSYEELHRDPTESLRACLAFFGAPPATDDALRSAVTLGTFESMRRFELDGTFVEANRRLVARDPLDPDSFKTRRGVVGGFREYLSGEAFEYVEERIAALMPPQLGYLEPGSPPRSGTRDGNFGGFV